MIIKTESLSIILQDYLDAELNIKFNSGQNTIVSNSKISKLFNQLEVLTTPVLEILQAEEEKRSDKKVK